MDAGLGKWKRGTAQLTGARPVQSVAGETCNPYLDFQKPSAKAAELEPVARRRERAIPAHPQPRNITAGCSSYLHSRNMFRRIGRSALPPSSGSCVQYLAGATGCRAVQPQSRILLNYHCQHNKHCSKYFCSTIHFQPTGRSSSSSLSSGVAQRRFPVHKVLVVVLVVSRKPNPSPPTGDAAPPNPESSVEPHDRYCRNPSAAPLKKTDLRLLNQSILRSPFFVARRSPAGQTVESVHFSSGQWCSVPPVHGEGPVPRRVGFASRCGVGTDAEMFSFTGFTGFNRHHSRALCQLRRLRILTVGSLRASLSPLSQTRDTVHWWPRALMYHVDDSYQCSLYCRNVINHTEKTFSESQTPPRSIYS
jgi:hypothetical protein